MTGGGFGGAVVAMLPDHLVETVRTEVCARYRTPAGLAPDIMLARPSAGASIVR
jgi:galactokinase